MGSERLPGKVLREVAGEPLLGHLLDRLGAVAGLDAIVVATTDRSEDDPVAVHVMARGHDVHRGDSDDVLGRLLAALEAQRADIAVVVYGDGPLIDPAIVAEVLDRFHQEEDADLVGNDLVTTFPPGMEVEVLRVAALADASARTTDPAVREHGTLAVRRDPERYRIVNVEATGPRRRPELELEVDTVEDLAVMEAVLAHLGHGGDRSLERIIAFLDANPALARANATVERRWKAFREGV
jgi:spore coat polysaccharide biosynthesis protein SpsF